MHFDEYLLKISSILMSFLAFHFTQYNKQTQYNKTSWTLVENFLTKLIGIKEFNVELFLGNLEY